VDSSNQVKIELYKTNSSYSLLLLTYRDVHEGGVCNYRTRVK